MSRPMQKLVWISFAALTLIAQAIAQGGATGAISGVVQDPSGAFIANADVRIILNDHGSNAGVVSNPIK